MGFGKTITTEPENPPSRHLGTVDLGKFTEPSRKRDLLSLKVSLQIRSVRVLKRVFANDGPTPNRSVQTKDVKVSDVSCELPDRASECIFPGNIQKKHLRSAVVSKY